jgi:hypothetical protein
VNDVAPASTAATAAINNDVRLCRTPRPIPRIRHLFQVPRQPRALARQQRAVTGRQT